MADSTTTRHRQMQDIPDAFDRMQVPAPREHTQPVRNLIIDHRSRISDNVEETILELYHAKLLTQLSGAVCDQPRDNLSSLSEISNQHRHVVRQIESWRKRPITKIFRYVFLAGVELGCDWGCGKIRASILTAVGVDENGVREVLGVAEGAIDSDSSWHDFLRQLKRQGLFGVCLFIGDRCAGLANRLSGIFPGAQFQNSAVQLRQDILALIPNERQQSLAKMLDGVFVSPDWPTARRLITDMTTELWRLESTSAAEFFEKHIWDSMNYLESPSQHRRLLQSNCAQIELLRGISERIRAVGAFPDGPSAVHLVSARLRHIEAKIWNEKCVAPGCYL